jgi:hypothetical protein
MILTDIKLSTGLDNRPGFITKYNNKIEIKSSSCGCCSRDDTLQDWCVEDRWDTPKKYQFEEKLKELDKYEEYLKNQLLLINECREKIKEMKNNASGK